MDTEGNWARYYEDYDHEADWDAWIDNEVRGDVEESTSGGEKSSDSSDSSNLDTGTAPLPDRLRLGKRKRTQARAEARRRKLSLQTRDTEPDDNNDEVKLIDPYAKWESSSDSSGWFTPVMDDAHFGYVNGDNQINWPGDSTPHSSAGLLSNHVSEEQGMTPDCVTRRDPTLPPCIDCVDNITSPRTETPKTT